MEEMDSLMIKSDFVKSIITSIIMKIMKKKLGISPLVSFEGPIKFEKDNNYADLDFHVHITSQMSDISAILKKYL